MGSKQSRHDLWAPTMHSVVQGLVSTAAFWDDVHMEMEIGNTVGDVELSWKAWMGGYQVSLLPFISIETGERYCSFWSLLVYSWRMPSDYNGCIILRLYEQHCLMNKALWFCTSVWLRSPNVAKRRAAFTIYCSPFLECQKRTYIMKRRE